MAFIIAIPPMPIVLGDKLSMLSVAEMPRRLSCLISKGQMTGAIHRLARGGAL